MVQEELTGHGQIPMGETCHRCGTPYHDIRAEYSYPNQYGGYNQPYAPMLYFTTGEKFITKKRELPKTAHTGLLVGFRYWLATNYKLAPIIAWQPWESGVNTAKCNAHTLMLKAHMLSITTANTTNTPTADDHTPDANCTCGIHLRAVPDPIDLSHAGVNKDTAILGACLAWGRILMHGTAGARVQHARPILLAYDPSWTKAKQGVVKGLAQDYDCRTMPVSYPDVERGVCDELLQAAREYGKLMGEMEGC